MITHVEKLFDGKVDIPELQDKMFLLKMITGQKTTNYIDESGLIAICMTLVDRIQTLEEDLIFLNERFEDIGNVTKRIDGDE